MTLIELAAEFRRQVADEALPYLWSEDEVFAYIVDAQDQLVRRLGGIADVTIPAADVATPADRIADLVVTADEPYTAHSPYILRIRSARLLTAARDVQMIQESDLPRTVFRDYGWSAGVQLDDADIGVVDYGLLGVRDNYVRWLKVPSDDDTCRMHVYRLPLPRLTGMDDADPQLEIAEQHHRHLILWMKHLAYSKHDAEARNDKLAAESAAAFEQYADRARREQERVRYRPRNIAYGGL